MFLEVRQRTARPSRSPWPARARLDFLIRPRDTDRRVGSEASTGPVGP